MKDIKDLLKELTISQEMFADKVGITRQTIYNIIHNKTKPTVLTIKLICKYLGEDWKEYIE